MASIILETIRGGGHDDLQKEYLEKYYNDPFAWIRDFVEIELPPYDVKIFNLVKMGKNKIAVRGPHGLGKSVLASLFILWGGSVSSDCKIPTTASAWRQLEKFLWPEVHKWYGHVNWKMVAETGGPSGIRLLNLECHFGPQSAAFAIASDKPETIEGVHAKRVIYIFDESKIIPAGIWESAEGAFSTPGDHLHIALSTPGDTSGVFYSICSRASGYEGWAPVHVTLREAVRAGRIKLSWAREKRRQWGRDSVAYQTRVWGNFATDSPDAVIPLKWVEMAVARWYAWQESGSELKGCRVIGADTAGQGVDQTAFFFRAGKVISKIVHHPKSRPMELAGELKNNMAADYIVNIDVSFGEGAGTADRLCEFEGMPERVNKVNFAVKTDRVDRTGVFGFANTRALMWWNMRELLDPDNQEDIALPPDELLIGDLTAARRLPLRSDGKLQIESKEDIKERIGRSTDDGDACCLAFLYDRYQDSGDMPGIGVV